VDRIDSMQRDPGAKVRSSRRVRRNLRLPPQCAFRLLTGQNIVVDVGASRGLFDQRSRCRLLVPQPNNAMTIAVSAVRVDRTLASAGLDGCFLTPAPTFDHARLWFGLRS
jgi:hypothetical protein